MKNSSAFSVYFTAVAAILVAFAGFSGCQQQLSKIPEEIRDKAEKVQKERRERAKSPQLEYGRNFISTPAEGGRILPWEELPVQEVAKKSLGRIGAPAVPYLIQGLQSPDVQQRRKAAEVLARIGPAAAAATEPLSRALSDPDEEVRRNAAIALGQIGPDAAGAVPRLMDLLMRDDAT
jgi:hypothetical protein